jgi:hypothetical protein
MEMINRTRREKLVKYYIGSGPKIWSIPSVLYDSAEEAFDELKEWEPEEGTQVFRVTVEEVEEDEG